MKTLRRLVTVALLVGAYSVGYAQDNSSPDFTSESEKKAWIENNRQAEKVKATKDIDNAEEKRAVVGSEKAKRTNVVQLNERQRQAPVASFGVKAPGKGNAVGRSPEKAVRVNNTHNAVPADYQDPNPSHTKTGNQ